MDAVDTSQPGSRSAGVMLARQRLLDAALDVFSERTYAGSAVPLVAERAGIAVGTIYRHYPGKQALGNAVYQRWMSRLLDRLTTRADVTTTRAAFAHHWSVLRDFAAEHPAAFAFLQDQPHAGYLDAESEALAVRFTEHAAALVKRGQERAEVRPGDPAVLAALAHGAFVGLARRRWSHGPAGVDDDAAETAVWDLLAA